MTAVLGVSDAACKKDATDAPAAVREITSVVATAPSASASPSSTATESATASASVTPSASVSSASTSTVVSAPPRLGGASCGATHGPGLLEHESLQQVACGARPEVRPPRANVTTTFTGAASGDERVIGAARPRLRNCANKGLVVDPTETGKAVVTIAVGANGDVTSSSVTSSAGLGAQTTACMASAFRIMTFPAGAARSIVVTIVQTIEVH